MQLLLLLLTRHDGGLENTVAESGTHQDAVQSPDPVSRSRDEALQVERQKTVKTMMRAISKLYSSLNVQCLVNLDSLYSLPLTVPFPDCREEIKRVSLDFYYMHMES